jgi:hypothetical protein
MEERKEFLMDFVKSVHELYNKLIEEYGIEEDRALFALMAGVYNDDDPLTPTDMMIGSVTTALDGEELNQLVDGAVDMYVNSKEEPKEGTIEWWIKHFGNDQELN